MNVSGNSTNICWQFLFFSLSTIFQIEKQKNINPLRLNNIDLSYHFPGEQNVMIQFKSRFLRPAEAILCLVARNIGGTLGMTLVFDLKTTIDTVTHSEVIKSESPCYEMQDIAIKVSVVSK